MSDRALRALVEQKIIEWRAVATKVRKYQGDALDVEALAYNTWADELSQALAAQLQEQEEDPRVDDTQYPKPLATASENKLGPASKS